MEESSIKTTQTIVFTDLESSSTLWREHREPFQDLLFRHLELAEIAAKSFGSRCFKTTGDGTMATFDAPSDAFAYAVEVQRIAQAGELLPDGRQVRVRAGIDIGEVTIHGGAKPDAYSTPVNAAARICDTAHGGQINASGQAVAIFRLSATPEFSFISLGSHELAGVGEVQIHRVEASGVETHDAPPRVKTKGRVPPAVHGPLIGRQETVERLLSDLEGKPRLFSLCGPGGMGKTRLALEAAHRLNDSGEPWTWAALETARTRDEFYSLLALALGQDLNTSSDLEALVRAGVLARGGVLFLDNLEQLEEAPALVGEVLALAPTIKIVITSRFELKLTMERVVRLAPLSREEGFDLFRMRMDELGLGDSLGPGDREAIYSISEKVDGVPLGILLAASMSRTFSPKQALRRIEQGVANLTGAISDLPNRQAGVSAMIQWSLQLLAPEERTALAEACAFEGTFSLEAFEAVSKAATPWVQLEDLLSKSLLVGHRSSSGDRIYAPYNSVLAYVTESDEQSQPVIAEARQRIAGYCAQELGACAERLRSDSEPKVFEAFGAQISVFQSGVRRALEADQSSQSWLLAAAFMQVASAAGWMVQAREVGRLLDWMCVRLSPEDPGAGEAALEHAGVLQDDSCLEEAAEWAAFAVECFTARGAKSLEGRARNLMGLIHRKKREWQEAAGCYENALALFESESDDVGMATVLCNIGVVAMNGATTSVPWKEALERSYRLRQRRKDLRGMAECLTNLGVGVQEEGDLPRSLDYHLNAWQVSQRAGDRYGCWRSAANTGEILELMGSRSQANQCLDFALHGFRSIQSRLAEAVEGMAGKSATVSDQLVPKTVESTLKRLLSLSD